MKNGKCIKCNSATIYTIRNGATYGGRIGAIKTDPTQSELVDYITYLCTTCGYFENYVDDQKILQKVISNKNWQKVG